MVQSTDADAGVLEEQERQQCERQQREREEQETLQALQEPRIPFSREDLINVHTLRNTEFQMVLIDKINEAHLYESTKRTLKTVVLNYTSSNVFLSNLEKGGRLSASNSDEILSAKLGMELDLLFATTAFCPTDNRSPDMVSIVNAIQSHTKFTLSRAKGSDRERKLQGKIESETTLRRIDQIQQPPQPIQKKKSFLSFLGR